MRERDITLDNKWVTYKLSDCKQNLYKFYENDDKMSFYHQLMVEFKDTCDSSKSTPAVNKQKERRAKLKEIFGE